MLRGNYLFVLAIVTVVRVILIRSCGFRCAGAAWELITGLPPAVPLPWDQKAATRPDEVNHWPLLRFTMFLHSWDGGRPGRTGSDSR
jgi:hypothetical protein